MPRSLTLIALVLSAPAMAQDDGPSFGNLQYTQAALGEQDASTFSGKVDCVNGATDYRIILMPPPDAGAKDKEKPEDAPEGGAPGVSPLTGGAVNADGQFEILVPAGQNAVLVVYQDANGNNRQDADETMLIANSGASLSTAADKTVNFSCTDDRVGGPMGEQSGDDAKPKQGEAAPE